MKRNTSQAFSLAEAMITLLIVCLITLASIPVITKKKRTPDNSAHGAYYCSKRWNETTKKFDLVHFSTINPVGDKDDISTWELVGGSDEYCKFVPPLNAGNFAVTLIGGGGAGARGVSEVEKKMENNAVYTPDEDGTYNIVMVGGGGGGANGDSYESYNPANYGYKGGGSGSGGGAVQGKIELRGGIKYRSYVGEGGSGMTKTTDPNGNTPKWASMGTNTFFEYTNEKTDEFGTILVARAGEGGEQLICDRDGYNAGCFGGSVGDPGYGALGRDFNKVVKSHSLKLLTGTAGNNDTHGVKGKNASGYNEGGPGLEFNGVTYGTGGKGIYRGTDRTKQKGDKGYFLLSLITLFAGEGGEAAVPDTVSIPKINGHLKLYIGDGGISDVKEDTDGGTSKVELYNKANIKLRQYVAKGAAAGKPKEVTYATAGADSLWTSKGGGAATGECKVLETEQVEKIPRGEETIETKKCLRAIGVKGVMLSSTFNLHSAINGSLYNYDKYKKIFAMYDIDKWETIGGLKHDDVPEGCRDDSMYRLLTDEGKADVAQGLKPATIGDIGDTSVPSTDYKPSCLMAYYCSKSQAINAIKHPDDESQALYLVKEDETDEEAMNALKYDDNFVCAYNLGDSEFIDKYREFASKPKTPENYDDFWDFIVNTKDGDYYKYKTYWSGVIYKDGMISGLLVPFIYQCAQRETKTVQTFETKVTPAGTPYCTQSASGSSFGAGGGGGATIDIPGYAGLGGRGAAGAVIVEW